MLLSGQNCHRPARNQPPSSKWETRGGLTESMVHSWGSSQTRLSPRMAARGLHARICSRIRSPATRAGGPQGNQGCCRTCKTGSNWPVSLLTSLRNKVHPPISDICEPLRAPRHRTGPWPDPGPRGSGQKQSPLSRKTCAESLTPAEPWAQRQA